MSKKVLIAITASLSLFLAACGDKKEAAPAGGGGSAADKSTASSGEVKLDPATAGTIKGMVKFSAPPETPPKVIDMGDKAQECGTASAPKTDEWYVVGENNGAGNVLVYVNKGPATNVRTPTPTAEVVVDQMNCMYTPRTLGMRAGQPLRFKSDDPTVHNIHFQGKLNGDWNMSMNPKSSFLAGDGKSQKVELAEFNPPVKLKCDVHVWMSANLGVFSHDAFYVTKKDGMFELKNLPPGDYEIAVYHERAGAKPVMIKLGPKETKDANFDLKWKD